MLEILTTPPPDKILQLAADFAADGRPNKMDLGVGVYKNSAGETVILRSVKVAEQRILDTQTTKSYVGPAGDAVFNEEITKVVLGTAPPIERLATAQTPGGGGALRLLTELIHKANSNATIWLPAPTWANHPAIIDKVGLPRREYDYFDAGTKEVNFDAMCASLKEAGPGDVVLLHGCCHNPTGASLSPAQWQTITAMAVAQGFLPYVDLAYQGFGDGLEEDTQGVRTMAAQVPEMLIATSCSKNFALYRERTGCAIALCNNAQSARATTGNLKTLARVNHSMPPDHGAAIVKTILLDSALRADWEAELTTMRNRILTLRETLADALRVRTNSDRYDFIARHRGMFSRLGATPEQVKRLRDEYAIFIVGDSRINVAGLREDRIGELVEALVNVGF